MYNNFFITHPLQSHLYFGLLPNPYCSQENLNFTYFYPFDPSVQKMPIPFQSSIQSQITLSDLNQTPDQIQKVVKDQDEVKSSENMKKMKKMQYVGRNDFSNMFKSFLYLVFKCQRTKSHIKNIIKIKNLPLTFNNFTNKLKRKFPDSKTYVGPKEIRKFFQKLEKDEFLGQNSIGILLKILLREFLEKEYKLYVIKKYKGKNQSKRQIFSKCRILYKQIFSQDE